MKTHESQSRRVMRIARIAVVGTAFAWLAACGGGSDDNPANATPPGGVKMQVVSFGDSLSDAGTYSPVITASFGGGRFTTNPGQVWTQLVATWYGGTLTPAYLGGFGKPLVATSGLGYAQGGSRVTDPNGIGHAPAGQPDYAQATTVPIATQVQNYLTTYGAFNPNQLVLVNGGANDIFYQAGVAQATIAAGGDPATAIATAGANVVTAATQFGALIAQVVGAGATHVIVPNVPDLGGTPEAVSTGTQATFSALSQGFNQAFTATLTALGVASKVVVIDTFTWQNGITANFRANGFTVSNTGTGCNLAAMIAAATASGQPNPQAFGSSLFCSPQNYTVPNADQTYMFADTVHPTTHLHALFATFAEQQIAASGVGK